ncbi:MAG: response regulator, partial [Pseudomonadota bacterium]
PGTLMQYNDVLVRKLESKMLEVENANQALQADIAARQQAEQALRQSEQDFRLLADAMPLMAWVVGPDDRGSYVNRRWLQYTGLKLDTPSQTWRTPLHPEDRGRADDHWRTANAKIEPFSLEARLVGVDGTHRWWLLSAVPVTDRDGAIIKWIGTCTDIEQLELAEARWRRAEAQLRQTQKMEAVGILAGGIAHDFNNLLLVIIGYSSLILDTIDPMDGFRTDVEEIMRAGERAKDLVQQLLAFSRRQVHAPRVLDLQTAVRNMERMLLRLLGEGIEVTLAAQPGCYVYADPNLIEQVILNLALNARDAMPSGGQVRFETLRVDVDEDSARPESIPVPGRYCLLRVTDTGVGIPDAYRDKIFHEFFQVDQTLVRRQGGTGLGLAIARRLARIMGGEISVESVVGRGSRFSLRLPRATGDLAHAPPPTLTTTPGAGPLAPATVLVVEDNEDNLFTLRQVLARLPLDLSFANSGRQAIEACRRQMPDLVIMDVQMPGMTGLQATGAIRALPGGAEVPILALTAQAMKGDRERILAAGCDDYVAKPFQPKELTEAIVRLLRRDAPGETIGTRAVPPASPPSDSPTRHGAHNPRR